MENNRKVFILTLFLDIFFFLPTSLDLVSGGSDVNCKEKMGGTSVFMMAVKKKQLQIVELLLETGARVDDEDKKGRSVMMMAESWENEMIRLKLAERLTFESNK